MEKQNLYTVLFADKVNHVELGAVLLIHFGHGQQLSLSEYQYGNPEASSLILRYDVNDDLVEIVAGKGWKGSDLSIVQEKIQKELLSSTEDQIGRQVFFTAVPTTNSYRYKDSFQIVPVPSEAPRPPCVVGDHPFWLEFRYPVSTNSMISGTRRSIIVKEFELLLSILLVYPVKTVGINARHHWVVDRYEGNDLVTAFKQEMYTWKMERMDEHEYTPSDAYQTLDKLPAQEYFAIQSIATGQVLSLPDNFETLCDRFFALPEKERARFLRACFWYQHANLVWHYSQSAMFTALASAIETLMPGQKGQKYCESCKRPLGPSLSQQFVTFVEKMVPDSAVSANERRKFYAIRSKLSHGGALFERDLTGFGLTFSPGPIEEWSDTRTMRQITRVSLISWLLAQTGAQH